MDLIESSQETGELFSTLDTLWILISAALVFFMQAGFKVLETGLVKAEHRPGIGVKNLMDWVAGSLAFFIIGFGLMFGQSDNGIIGTSLFFGTDLEEGYSLVFFIFQLAFAGTALTIVSGAMSGRTALAPYFVASLFTAVIVYPVFGHWAWGNLLIESNKPWLASLGFMDFAGSTVVHSVGAWVGLAGIYMVGPRLGRFNAKGVVQPVKASDYAYSVLGLMILWLGWWGFNGGSTLAFDESVPLIILNTNLAAAAACLSAYLHAKFAQDNRDIVEKIIGGALTGLVAITACCNVVTPANSIIIGLLAGLIHNLSYSLILNKWKLDDPVGAIPVHGFGGIFGTLCVALFGREEMLSHDRWTQLGVQSIGILTCLVFTLGVALLIFYTLKVSIGLRLSPTEERTGAVFTPHNISEEKENNEDQIVSQVSVKMGERSYNLFKVDEYLNISREMRLGLVRTNSVQYLNENGDEVPSLHAVRYLAGVIEQQRDRAATKEEILELALDKDQGNLMEKLSNNLLNHEHSIFSVFQNSFVLLKPQGKVPLDFFWHGQVKGFNIVIIASCNKQEVSSSFISSIVMSQLNEIVVIKKTLPPEKILTQLDEKLQLALQKSSKDGKLHSGVDVGVLIVDDNKRSIYYSAAGMRIKLYVKNIDEALYELKGLDIPLGNSGIRNFERRKIDYNRGDSFFLCSAGYSNQLNESGKRYSSTRLKDSLAKNAGKSMDDQRFVMMRELETWKGKEEQTEDVLMIGLKP